MAEDYFDAAKVIRKQTKELRLKIKSEPDPENRADLRSKMASLSTILTELNSVGKYLYNYYDEKYVYTKVSSCKITDYRSQSDKTTHVLNIDPTNSITQNCETYNIQNEED